MAFFHSIVGKAFSVFATIFSTLSKTNFTFLAMFKLSANELVQNIVWLMSLLTFWKLIFEYAKC